MNAQKLKPIGVGKPGDFQDEIFEAPPQVVERRLAIRHPLYLQISCCTLQICGGTSWQATVKDISTKGIGLLLCRPFGPGTVLSAELPDTESIVGWSVTLRVVHCRKVAEGQWLAGCVFATQLGAGDLQKWVSFFPPQESLPPQEETVRSDRGWLLVLLLGALLGVMGVWVWLQMFGLE